MSAAKTLFRHPEIGSFFQVQPKLENPFLGDGFLRRLLARVLPPEMERECSKDLTRFGERVKNELEPLSTQCELNPPYLNHFDPWGKRIDEVVTCDAWKKMKGIAAEEGIVAMGYERKFGEFTRLAQMAKHYLYNCSSGLYACPLAMTDGAAKTIESLGRKGDFDNAYKHLTTRNPAHFWTSGQWMTERRGGSDVGSGTETTAVPLGDGTYGLHGYKWFSSATDSDMTFTLARIAGPNGETIDGSRGLSMFFMKTRKEDNTLNNIQVMRLKNKLGTRQLPTGELLLDGSIAHLASDSGRGIPAITNMLTITRIHNASASVAAMRRILSLARDYSKRRVCFGTTIENYPLHVQTLSEMEVETRGSAALFFEVARLLGYTECTGGRGATGEEEYLLRILTPIVKLYTGKKCVPLISEGLEAFGGQGYIEDTQLPKIMRDAQVTPIWEGTTNILSLDVLRALGKSKGEALVALNENLKRRLAATASHSHLAQAAEKVKIHMNEIASGVTEVREISAREFAFSIAEVTIGTLLLEHAAYKGAAKSDITCANRFVEKMSSFQEKLQRLSFTQYSEDSKELVFDSYQGE